MIREEFKPSLFFKDPCNNGDGQRVLLNFATELATLGQMNCVAAYQEVVSRLAWKPRWEQLGTGWRLKGQERKGRDARVWGEGPGKRGM